MKGRWRDKRSNFVQWWTKGRTGVREGDPRGVREKATKLIKIKRAPRVFL